MNAKVTEQVQRVTWPVIGRNVGAGHLILDACSAKGAGLAFIRGSDHANTPAGMHSTTANKRRCIAISSHAIELSVITTLAPDAEAIKRAIILPTPRAFGLQ
ncbi:hypothetical protein [Roseicitreum antarcticum]|uniref:hypothetical protein n=1 Tax=Roseicitreum antarcticum TaxID=564137 RepID=UPI001CC1EB96|nr:hypothetical protein [Roseicitreum antarcticum]